MLTPHYANVTVRRIGGGSPAWTSPRDTPGNRVAAKVLEELLGAKVKYYRWANSRWVST